MRWRRGATAGLICVGIALLVAGCAAPSPAGPARGDAPASQKPAGLKRVTAAFMGEAIGLSNRARGTGPAIGVETLEELVNAGLVTLGGQGVLSPRIAERVPSIENGLWKLLPDGRMETTWRIKENVRWHDSAPFTTADLLFTARFDDDREVPIARNIAFDSVERVEAPDARTVVVHWKKPFIHADRLFSREYAFPLPRHLLEAPYLEDPAAILQHPYWTTEYVGLGPFKLRELARGSHIILEADPAYVMGRPQIDEIEVRLIPDSNALVANLLAGAVEMTLGHSLSVEQALQVRDQWRDGKIEMAPGNWVTIHPQLLNPTPAVVANLQFRRALVHAVDRRQMADTLMSGTTEVAHTFLNPNQPQYRDIEAAAPRYEYDPGRAAQMIEGLGFARGPDGSFRDGAGQALSVELRTTAQYDVQRGSMLAVADYWQRAGVATETLMVPVQRQRDPEYRAAFPAFELLNGPPSDVGGLQGLHSSRARVPANNFVGSNYSRYMNPEFDALLEGYFVTVPRPQRIEILGKIIRHIAENLVSMGLFYNDRPIAIGERLRNVAAPTDRQATQAWNAHEWGVK